MLQRRRRRSAARSAAGAVGRRIAAPAARSRSVRQRSPLRQPPTRAHRPQQTRSRSARRRRASPRHLISGCSTLSEVFRPQYVTHCSGYRHASRFRPSRSVSACGCVMALWASVEHRQPATLHRTLRVFILYLYHVYLLPYVYFTCHCFFSHNHFSLTIINAGNHWSTLHVQCTAPNLPIVLPNTFMSTDLYNTFTSFQDLNLFTHMYSMYSIIPNIYWN